MKDYFPKLLDSFLAIPQAKIDEDISLANRDSNAIREKMNQLPFVDLDPKRDAERFHYQLCLANSLFHKNTILEIRICFGSIGAEMIGEFAGFSSMNRGELAAIYSKVEALENKPHLTPDATPERKVYKDLSEKGEALFEKIMDTVIVHAFDRYGLNECSRIYENDRAEFDILREKGRLVAISRKGTSIDFDELVSHHGKDDALRIKNRVSEILNENT